MIDFVRVFGDHLADGEAGKGTWRLIMVGEEGHVPEASAVISCPDCATQFGLGDYAIKSDGIVQNVQCWGQWGSRRCTFKGTIRLLGWPE